MSELEQLLRRIVREELASLLGVKPEQIEEADESDLRARVAERSARMRAARGTP